MKSQNSLTPSSRSYRFWIAGIFLSAACILFIGSQIHDRWSTFPFRYRELLSIYSGIWRRSLIYSNYTASFPIRCLNERIPCTKLFIARIFMIATCITSGIGAICLCLLSMLKTKYKPLLCMTGLILAILSFLFGLVGFVSGLSWVLQFNQDVISSSGISVLIASFLSLASAISVFFINLNESM